MSAMEKPDGYRSDLDLLQLVKVLVHRKWLIIIGTLAFTIAVIGITFIMPKVYESDGFFQLSRGVEFDMEELKKIQEQIREDFQKHEVGNRTLQKNLLLTEVLQDNNWLLKNVSVPDYKKYSAQFTNPSQFRRFIDHNAKNPGSNNKNIDKKRLEELKTGIKKTIRTSDDLAQWFEPVYAYSKKDLANLGQIAKDVRNFVVGIRITGEQNSPKNARALVSILGNFVKDCIIYGKMTDYIGDQLNRCTTEGRIFDNNVIKDQFKLKQLQAKRDELKILLTRYPQSKSMSGRELVSLELGGHRYLSPVAQLVGTESHIADLKENIAHNTRSSRLMNLKADYYSRAKKLLEKEQFGTVLLDKCLALKDFIQKEKNIPEDVKKQAVNELEIDLEKFNSLRRDMQYVSLPSLPDKPVKPRKAIITAVAFLLAFFFFIVLAFFLEWWQTNKKQIEN